MTSSDTKAMWVERHRQLSVEAEGSRDSQLVSFGMLEAFDALSDDDKRSVHGVLAEWFASPDARLRYDAKFVTSQRCIREMAPFVEEAITNAERNASPPGVAEAEDLRRLLAELRH